MNRTENYYLSNKNNNLICVKEFFRKNRIMGTRNRYTLFYKGNENMIKVFEGFIVHLLDNRTKLHLTNCSDRIEFDKNEMIKFGYFLTKYKDDVLYLKPDPTTRIYEHSVFYLKSNFKIIPLHNKSESIIYGTKIIYNFGNKNVVLREQKMDSDYSFERGRVYFNGKKDITEIWNETNNNIVWNPKDYGLYIPKIIIKEFLEIYFLLKVLLGKKVCIEDLRQYIFGFLFDL